MVVDVTTGAEGPALPAQQHRLQAQVAALHSTARTAEDTD